MGLLADHEIEQMCIVKAGDRQMIEPFLPEQVRQIQFGNFHSVTTTRAISFGLSSYGYDARLSGEEFRLYRWCSKIVADPKHMDERLLVNLKLYHDETGDFFVMPPQSYGLGHTIETFALPRDILMVCVGKSTNARAGILANVTPGEPAWRGTITLEIANKLPVPLKIYANEGIAQFIFLRGDSEPRVCYGDRPNHYQDQRGVTLPKV